MANKLVIPRCAAPGCLNDLPPRAKRGPARRYCGATCRSAAYRQRQAVAAELVPADASDLADLSLEACWTPEPPGDDEQVARAISDAKGPAGQFLRLGREARPQFAWRCENVGLALAAALDEYFEGI